MLNGLQDQVTTKLKSSLGDCSGGVRITFKANFLAIFPLPPPLLRANFGLGLSHSQGNCVGIIMRYNGNKATHLIVTIPTITLVFFKLFSTAKNRNVIFKI